MTVTYLDILSVNVLSELQESFFFLKIAKDKMRTILLHVIAINSFAMLHAHAISYSLLLKLINTFLQSTFTAVMQYSLCNKYAS